MRSLPAFSLIELLVVCTIVAILSVGSFLGLSTIRSNQALTASSEKLKTVLTQAHIYARESKDNKAWGVYRLDNNTYRFRTRTSASDPSPVSVAEYSLEQPISFATANFDIWFDQGTGNTTQSSIQLTAPSGRTATVTINAAGVVEVGP